jgi:hypothetical protein
MLSWDIGGFFKLRAWIQMPGLTVEVRHGVSRRIDG